jgi:peroxiredoxin
MCLPGLEQLDELMGDFRRQGVDVMAIASTGGEQCREFGEALGVNYPIYADPEWKTFNIFGAGRLGSLPLHCWAIVDGKGILQWVWRLNGPDPQAALPMPVLALDKAQELFGRQAA